MKRTRPSAARAKKVWDLALLASSTSWKYAENIFVDIVYFPLPTPDRAGRGPAADRGGVRGAVLPRLLLLRPTAGDTGL